MKKVIVVIIGVILLAIIAGCDYNHVPRSGQKVIDGNRFVVSGVPADDIQMLTDTETGCQYLILYKSSSINGVTSLLDSKGQPTGCKDISKGETK